MKSQELISIVMASNRVDDYLHDAIDSMLSQTYSNIELIFVANGPNALEVSNFLKSQFQDLRLKIIETPIAQLAFSLNLGIALSKGLYIARMDADDISTPERLQKQVNYMKEHQLDMVGSDLELINSFGDHIGIRKYPKGIVKINRQLPYRNTFAHNTILIKKKTLLAARGYNSGFNSEDYDLWLRLKRQGINWDNMSDCFTKYRIHEASTQRRKLGYAESAGYSLREFILNFSFSNLIAIVFHIIKSYSRSK